MESNIPESAWPLILTATGLALGLIAFAVAIRLIPKWMDRITPNIDESKEILNGNQAVATYFGRIVSASIIGLSIIIAAAIIAGIHGF